MSADQNSDEMNAIDFEEQYHLEIYLPGSCEIVQAIFASDTPFMTIGVNDLINPAIWGESAPGTTILRVVNVEHLIWESETSRTGVKHKLCVFTEAVKDTIGARLGERSVD